MNNIQFDPNPQGFTISKEMLAVLSEWRLVAATAENYGVFEDGKQSQLFTTEPGVMLQGFEGSTGWEVRVLKQLSK
jgi:hypothetical protein